MPACIRSSAGEDTLCTTAEIVSAVLAILPAWVAHNRTTKRAVDNMDCSLSSLTGGTSANSGNSEHTSALAV